MSRVRASRSAATATSAPRSCAAAIDGATGRGPRRDAPGYCSSTPNDVAVGQPVACRSATTTSMPSGSARVAHDGDGLREAVGVDDEDVARRPCRPRRSSVIASAAAVRLVEQRGVGDRQAGQVGDHGLEVQQRLEPALARSPAGTACRRCTRPGSPARCAGSPAGVMRAVVAQADHRGEHLVAAGERRAARRAPRPRCAPAGRSQRLGARGSTPGTAAATSASSEP